MRDITDLRRAEEERHRFFSLSFDLQAVVSFDGHLRRVNPAFEATLGFTSEELLARPYLDFIHPDDRAAVVADVEQLAAGRTRHDVDLRCLCKDGSYRWIAWTSVPVVEDGVFYSVGRDTTERRRAEQALEERARLAELGAEVGIIVTRDLPLREILQRSAESLVRHVDAAFARIWTLDPVGDVLELQASAGMYTHLDGPHGRVPVGQFKIGRIAQERLPHLTNAVVGDPLIPEQEWAVREGMVAFAGYPLLVDDRLVGVMALFARRPLSDDTLQAMASISYKVALAVERRWTEQALRQSEERFRSLSVCSPVGIFTADIEGRCTYTNPQLHAILGHTSEEYLGEGWQRFLHPDDRGWVLERWSAAKREGREFDENYRYRTAKRGDRWIHGKASPMLGDQGRLVGYAGTLEDITERQATEHALREAEARIRAVVDHVVDGIITIDQHGTLESFNPAAERIFGYQAAEVLGRNVKLLIPEPDRSAHDGYLANYARASQRTIVCSGREVMGLRSDGSTFPMDLAVSEYPLDGRRVFTGIVRDITERKRAEDQLTYQATHDLLTGLPNRTLLQRHMEQAIASSRDQDASFALLLLDLDRFKEINDTFGHHYGDTILQQVSPRLLGAVRESDTVARLGGDEFGICLPCADRATADQIAERILASLKQPILVDGLAFDASISIGIALYPEHGQDIVTLMQRADVAMYKAKRAQIGRAVYAVDQADYTPRRLALISELRQGIEDNQLLLHYQPKIDLKTMRVSGVEALTRWQHPREGLLPPAEFIPLAEHTGLIKPLGLWALHTALLQCQAWHRLGVNLNVAVNLAPQSLQDEQLEESILTLLKSSDALSQWLTLEVTERAVMTNPARAKAILSRLHEIGVRISIDDFGTGYSSLAYLTEFPVDEVKVDQSFVKEMVVNERDACIVRAVIDLGHNLGLRVVAEGVEDRASLELLASWGCDLAQGFYVSRPLPPAELNDWMGTSTKKCLAHGAEGLRSPNVIPKAQLRSQASPAR